MTRMTHTQRVPQAQEIPTETMRRPQASSAPPHQAGPPGRLFGGARERRAGLLARSALRQDGDGAYAITHAMPVRAHKTHSITGKDLRLSPTAKSSP